MGRNLRWSARRRRPAGPAAAWRCRSLPRTSRTTTKAAAWPGSRWRPRTDGCTGRLRAVTEGYPPRRQRLVEVMVTAIPRVPAAAPIWLVTCRFSARHGGRPSARAGSGLPGRVVVGTRAPDGGSGAHGTTPGLDVVVTGLGVAVTGGRDGAGR